MSRTEAARFADDPTLDRRLADAFAFEPGPAASAEMGRRVETAIASAAVAAVAAIAAVDGAAGGGAAVGRGPAGSGLVGRASTAVQRATWRRRAVGLLVAAVVLGGAGRGIVGLYEQAVGSDGGWRTAWDRADILGVSQTHDGYRVTVERAYADINQLMLAVSVSDVAKRGWTQVGAGLIEVTDEQGRPFGQTMGMGLPDGSTVSANLAWLTPPAGLLAGNHTLRVSVGSVSVRDNSTPPPDETPGVVSRGDQWNPWHEVAGPWTFAIPLTVRGGSSVEPDAAATVGGATVRLTRVTVSPSAVSGSITVTAADGSEWAPVGSFRHAGSTFAIQRSGGAKDAGADSGIAFVADDGTADASGEWTLQIDELVGLGAGSGQVRLQGPWTLRFTVP